MTDPDTARERAFDSLVGLSAPVREALDRVDVSVAAERKNTSAGRAAFTRTQRMAIEGSTRFASAVDEVGRALVATGRVLRVSTPVQEAQNIFLWLVDSEYMFRIKHDLDDVEDPGAAHLFSVADPAVRQTVFLTWEVSADGTIKSPTFATVEEPRWAISLGQLVASSQRPQKINAERRGPRIQSSKSAEDTAQEDS